MYAIQLESGQQWEDVCIKLPVVNADAINEENNNQKRPRRSIDDQDFFGDDESDDG